MLPGRDALTGLRGSLSRPYVGVKLRAPAFWWRGEVQLDRLAAGTRARLDGELFGAGLEDEHRDLLGAVDAHPGAEHPATSAATTRLVRLFTLTESPTKQS